MKYKLIDYFLNLICSCDVRIELHHPNGEIEDATSSIKTRLYLDVMEALGQDEK